MSQEATNQQIQHLFSQISDSLDKKDFRETQDYINQILDLDPHHEKAHRQQMWLWWQTREPNKSHHLLSAIHPKAPPRNEKPPHQQIPPNFLRPSRQINKALLRNSSE